MRQDCNICVHGPNLTWSAPLFKAAAISCGIFEQCHNIANCFNLSSGRLGGGGGVGGEGVELLNMHC